ncbi:MAG: hypothetical protein IKQ37_09200 [Bacteroidaceae bacterium]|nr:hypothetical protein [Bacteroidaceae bacterium]
MKKTYQSPLALIVELQINKSLLLTTSENYALDGGWVKEDVGVSNSSVSDKNVWDEEW